MDPVNPDDPDSPPIDPDVDPDGPIIYTPNDEGDFEGHGGDTTHGGDTGNPYTGTTAPVDTPVTSPPPESTASNEAITTCASVTQGDATYDCSGAGADVASLYTDQCIALYDSDADAYDDTQSTFRTLYCTPATGTGV